MAKKKIDADTPVYVKVSKRLKAEKTRVDRDKKAKENYGKLSADDQRRYFKGTKTEARRGRKSRYS